jgi:hypothetical protein
MNHITNKHSIPISWWMGSGLAFGLIALIVWLAFYGNETATSSKSNREVALACTNDTATRFHIHFDLEIVINGEKQIIPTDIGVSPACMNALHTHDTSGQIHIESPQKRDFTLADFFAVWGKTYNKDQIIDSKVDDRYVIRETVNGEEVENYENTILRDDDKIVIFYEEKKL